MTNLPLTGKFNITAVFKQINKKLWKTLGFHTGLDFTGSDNIYATCDGVVDAINYSNSYGNYIIIRENNIERYHYFCHLKKVLVQKGTKVNRTTIIGIMGATGNVTGKHLHYEIRKSKGNLVESNLVNPAEYCQIPNAKGNYNSKDFPVGPEKNTKYQNGDAVETSFQVRVIKETDSEHYLVESNGYEFELHKTMIKNLNKDNIGNVIERGTIFAQINDDTYGIEILDRQFNIKEYYISKKL